MKPRIQLMGAIVVAGLLAAVQLYLRPSSKPKGTGSSLGGIGPQPSGAMNSPLLVSNASSGHAPAATGGFTSGGTPTAGDAFWEFNSWLRDYLALPPESRAKV